MPACSSAVVVTDDVDRFHEVLRPSGGNFTVAAPGPFIAKHVRVDLHRIRMQCAEENVPRIWERGSNPERQAILFQALPGPSLFTNGTRIGPGDIALHNASNAILCHRITGPTRWSSLSLPSPAWEEIGVALGHDPMARPDLPKIRVSETALARLRRRHASAIELAESTPEVIADPGAALGLESGLIQSVVDCLSTSLTPPAPMAATRRHTTIMKHLYQALEENAGRPIYLLQLCVAVGASDRTLRLCCQEYFGVGPKRYLYLRRMHLARRALLAASTDKINVTTIATEFGFWELGRFAVNYHALFGESPSATLRRARRLV